MKVVSAASVLFMWVLVCQIVTDPVPDSHSPEGNTHTHRESSITNETRTERALAAENRSFESVEGLVYESILDSPPD